ncbi:MAG TPA: DEAD/DEAH box helicase [Agriterribacter sp.]|nr:DEAD/DEAH box helicase [Agriterribacter sp.]
MNTHPFPPPTLQQSAALEQLKQFVLNPAEEVFILKGYAGTGKTTLMAALMQWLTEDDTAIKKFNPQLCATTGRAAKVLRDKTGYDAITVHSFIYSFKDISQDIEKIEQNILHPQFNPKTNQLLLMFELRPPALADERAQQQIIIVDEASMLSDGEGNSDFAMFGTGRLLTDLMTYAQKSKLIFVGDDCQLPPVQQDFSPALDAQYISSTFNRKVRGCELTDIVRQQKDHSVLKLSLPLRRYTTYPQPGNYAMLPAKQLSNIIMHRDTDALIDDYITKLRKEGYLQTIMITRSNNFNFHISHYVRKQLGFKSQMPVIGDLLLVTQNNYLVPLVNGDFVEVTATGQMKLQANIPFMEIAVKGLHDGKHYNCLLALSPLTRIHPNLNTDEFRSLMIDFARRLRKKNISQKSPAFLDAMRTDPYLNSLRASYGYAVTCNKSQGGEWPHVYLHMETKIQGLGKPGIYRWWYTAITRSSRQLHLSDDWFITVYDQAFDALGS